MQTSGRKTSILPIGGTASGLIRRRVSSGKKPSTGWILTGQALLNYSQQVLATAPGNLVGYWHLGEASGNFADSSGNSITLTASGGITYSQTSLLPLYTVTKGISLNGTTGQGQVASSSTYSYDKGQAWTMIGWWNPSWARAAEYETHPLLSNIGPSSAYAGYESATQYETGQNTSYYPNAAGMRVNLTLNHVNGTNALVFQGRTDVVNSVTYFYAITYDGLNTATSFRAWLNGQEEPLTNTENNLTGSIVSVDKVTLGARPIGGSFHQGGLQEVAFWNIALTPAQIIKLYESGVTTPTTQTTQIRTFPVPLIEDDDSNADADGTAVFGEVFALQASGMVNLLGMVSDTSATGVPSMYNTITYYYGYPSFNIGKWNGTSFQPGESAWVTYLTGNFTNPQSSFVDSTTLYRTAFANMINTGGNIPIWIHSQGFLSAIYAFLTSSADGISSLTGAQLIAANKSVLVIDAGSFSGGVESNLANNASNNFYYGSNYASYVVANWPSTVVFVPDADGWATTSGGSLSTYTPATNPIAAAFTQNYGANTPRYCWANNALLYIVGPSTFGLPNYIEERGTCTINSTTGANSWAPAANGPHILLRRQHTALQAQNVFETLNYERTATAGPLTGTHGVASSNFTVTLLGGNGATFSGSQSITISDGGNGGTITPSVGSPGTSTCVVTPTSGTSSFTFTYTAAAAGTYTLAYTNSNSGWYPSAQSSYFKAS